MSTSPIETPQGLVERKIGEMEKSGEVTEAALQAFRNEFINVLRSNSASNQEFTEIDAQQLLNRASEVARESRYDSVATKEFPEDKIGESGGFENLSDIENHLNSGKFSTRDIEQLRKRGNTALLNHHLKQFSTITSVDVYLDSLGVDDPTKAFIKEGLNKRMDEETKKFEQRLNNPNLSYEEAEKEVGNVKNEDLKAMMQKTLERSAKKREFEAKKIANDSKIFGKDKKVDPDKLLSAIDKNDFSTKNTTLLDRMENRDRAEAIKDRNKQGQDEITKMKELAKEMKNKANTEYLKGKAKEWGKWAASVGLPAALISVALLSGGSLAPLQLLLASGSIGAVGAIGGGLGSEVFSTKIKDLNIEKKKSELEVLRQGRAITDLRRAIENDNRQEVRKILQTAKLA